MDLPEPLGPTTATVRPGGNRERDVEQDLPVRLVAEIDVLEAHLAIRNAQRRGAGRILDLGVLLDQPEQPLHVGERLLDLAVDDAEEVERNVELDHEGVDQHEVADRHRVIDDAENVARHMISVTATAMIVLCPMLSSDSDVWLLTAADSQRCMLSS